MSDTCCYIDGDITRIAWANLGTVTAVATNKVSDDSIANGDIATSKIVDGFAKFYCNIKWCVVGNRRSSTNDGGR